MINNIASSLYSRALNDGAGLLHDSTLIRSITIKPSCPQDAASEARNNFYKWEKFKDIKSLVQEVKPSGDFSLRFFERGLEVKTLKGSTGPDGQGTLDIYENNVPHPVNSTQNIIEQIDVLIQSVFKQSAGENTNAFSKLSEYITNLYSK